MPVITGVQRLFSFDQAQSQKGVSYYMEEAISRPGLGPAESRPVPDQISQIAKLIGQLDFRCPHVIVKCYNTSRPEYKLPIKDESWFWHYET